MREKRIGGVTFGVLAIGMILMGQGRAPAAEKTAKADDSEALFSLAVIPKIQIEIPEKGMERLRGRGWSWGWTAGSRDRPEVQAMIREGDQVYTNVALHLKGAAGSFQPLESKPGLTLNFDKYAKGQKFHGLEKLSLNNSVQDPSFSSERLCRELFNAAGVPAPRAAYALVELNGRNLGLYVLLEGYNRQFLKRHYKESKGNLYEGGFLKDVDSTLATNSGDPKDQSGLRALVEAAREPNRDIRFERLGEVLDMDRFITFLAMEVMVCHWDGYAMNKNNYRVYHDPEFNRMVFMPHGMDQMFGIMMVRPAMDVSPVLQGLVARAVLDTREGRRRYFRRLAELNDTLFDVDVLTNRVLSAAVKLQPLLAEVGAPNTTTHLRDVEEFCDRISQRKLSLDEQLTGARGTMVDFDSNGAAKLNGWISVTNFGSPLVADAAGPDGIPVLRIVARGASVASWRTKAFLEEGHYRFEGRMRTSAVAADPRDQRAGAGLRVYGKTSNNKTLGDSDWREIGFEFEVPSGIQDVELICELRADKGEAWFDRDSLRLLRK